MGEFFTLKKALSGTDLTEHEDHTIDNIVRNMEQAILANNIVERPRGPATAGGGGGAGYPNTIPPASPVLFHNDRTHSGQKLKTITTPITTPFAPPTRYGEDDA
jgi:hypothetical protein